MSEIDDIINAANEANKANVAFEPGKSQDPPIKELGPRDPVKDSIFGKDPVKKLDLKEDKEVEEVPYVETKEDVHAKIGAILAQYGNMESNIPMNHEYWGLTNKYRNM